MITATIITLNEEYHIKEAIISVKKIANEIIIVDSGSTDKTIEIAKELGAKVYTQSYLGDGAQKDFGVQFASNDWIFSIDADERLDDELVASIKSLDLTNDNTDAFKIKRKNFIGSRYQSSLDSRPIPRLYHKARTRYDHAIIHAGIPAKNTKTLSGFLLHYTYRDYLDLFKKNVFFIDLTAQNELNKGKKIHFFSPILQAKWAFFKAYFLKGGFRCGIDGLTLSLMTFMSIYMRFASVYEKQKLQK